MTWTSDDSKQARKEGWDILFIGDLETQPEIQADFDTEILDDDDHAIALVESKARAGSPLHVKALGLERSWDHGQGRFYWEDEGHEERMEDALLRRDV